MSDLSNIFESISEFGQKPEVKTVYENFSWMFKPRETITETPRAGYPSGQDAANTNNILNKTADTVTAGMNFFTQIKGLFGLGYDQPEVQPVSPINQEISPATVPMATESNQAISPMILVAGGAIILLLLLK